MAKKVEVSQAELDALRQVFNAAKHLTSMTPGVSSREPKLTSELHVRRLAWARLEEALKLATVLKDKE
jgi:hypothetical protein